jgi:hypothetical protein
MIIERFFGKGRSAQSASPGESAPPDGQQGPAQTPIEAQGQQKPRAQDRCDRAAKPAPSKTPAKQPSAARVQTGGPATARAVAAAPAPEPTHEEIAARAYDLWIAQGCPQGRDHEIWIEAERQLRAARKT